MKLLATLLILGFSTSVFAATKNTVRKTASEGETSMTEEQNPAKCEDRISASVIRGSIEVDKEKKFAQVRGENMDTIASLSTDVKGIASNCKDGVFVTIADRSNIFPGSRTGTMPKVVSFTCYDKKAPAFCK